MTNPCDKVCDGTLIWRYLTLTHRQRLEIAKKSGQTLEGVSNLFVCLFFKFKFDFALIAYIIIIFGKVLKQILNVILKIVDLHLNVFKLFRACLI